MQKTFLFFALLFSIALSARAQAPEPGIWVVYGGKEQFRLADARRIPSGELVSIRGYPLPAELPQVWLRNPDSGKREALEVAAEPENHSWLASVPNLKPNVRTEIVVNQFKPLTTSDIEKVELAVDSMLFNFLEGWNTGRIPAEADATQMGRLIEDYLVEQFPPEKTLAEYVRLKDGKSQSGTLGGELISLIGTEGVTDSTLRNLLSDYHEALKNLNNDLVVKQLNNALLPANAKKTIEDFWKKLPSGLFATRAEVGIVWVKEVLKQRPPLLPLSPEVAAALNDLITVANAGQDLREDITTLQTPLKDKFPKLFSSLRRIEATTFSTQTISFPFLSGDLLRYGTVDFVQGYITGLKALRGFLIFSFFPTGPQERTPNGVAEGRVAVALGYSVTGGEKDDEPFYLLGLNLRSNRYISMTAGAVVRTKGGGPWYGFAGVAADITAIPFLNDLLTVRK